MDDAIFAVAGSNAATEYALSQYREVYATTNACRPKLFSNAASVTVFG